MKTENGTDIFADKIISSIGIKETLLRFLPKQEHPVSLVKTLEKHKSVPSFLLLLIGFEGDISSFGIKKSAYKTIIGNPSTMLHNPTEKGWVCDDLTISFPSFLDKKHKDKNHHTAEIHHETRFEFFEKYEGYISSHDYKRDDDKKLANLAKKIRE